MADTPGYRMKVLAAGLRQLGDTCEKMAAELSTSAAFSLITASPWQSNATTVNIGAAAASRDLIVIAQRVDTRGAGYSKAGTAYTGTEDDNAAQLRRLVT
jgi:hypothetical protein